MKTLVAYTILNVCVVSLLIGFATPFAGKCECRSFIRLLAFAAVYTFVLLLPVALNWHIGEWNWIGKALGISLSLAAVRLFNLTSDETGLRFPATSQAWWLSGFGIVIASGFMAGIELLIGPGSRPGAQAFLLAIM